MKKSLKKISILLMNCLLITAMLFGCTAKKEMLDTGEITIMAPLNGISQPEQNRDIEKAIQDLTGEKVNIIWIPKESYKDKSMMMIASGEIPDILVVEDETEDIVKGAEQGGFWNVGPYLKDYTNLCNVDQNILKNSSFRGEVYGIYRYKNPIDNAIVLRKDWIEKLGLKEPNNTDEFKEVLKKVTYDDPDGNGLNDTYGLGISGADYNVFNSVISQVATWFGAPNKWKIENEVLTPSFMTIEYKDALDYIKGLYEEGLIDPKFYSTNSSDVKEKFKNNKYGAVMENQTDAIKLENSIKEKYPNSDSNKIITAIGGFRNNNAGKILSKNGYSGLLMFPKRKIKTEEKLKKVLSFVDKLNSKEGYMLLNYGIEGKNYTLKDDSLNFIESSSNYDLLSYSEISTNWNKESISNVEKSQFTEELKDIQEVSETDRAVNIAAPLKVQGHIKNGNELEGKIDELNAQFVFGKINKDEYEARIEEWLDNGGDKYIQKVNDLHKEYLKKR
jgi:putative aldouronate transport system substrate-binding protein